MAPELTTDRPALSPADRCDRCGAQAYVRATLHDGGELLFCGHHAREHADRLREVASVQDDSGVLDSPGGA